MIRIHRGAEPDELRDVRDTNLPRVRALAAGSPPTADDIGRDYAIVRELLLSAQHRKCAFCEKLLEGPYDDVDHFRPKVRAVRGSGFPDYGYWWLAWTWENLLRVCAICNRTHKRDAFPLEVGSVALVPEQSPPGEESPLLLDPADPRHPDPIDAIRFVPIRVGDATRWVPIGITPRGRRTIEVLGLHREDLIPHYDRHVTRIVRPLLTRFRDVSRTRNPAAIHRAWHRMCRRLLRAGEPFAALSHDVIAREVSADTRERWRLQLHRPPLRRL